eukprot:5031280-Amphidinium_carterae.1
MIPPPYTLLCTLQPPCTPRSTPQHAFHFHPVPPPNPLFMRAVLYLDIDTHMLCPPGPLPTPCAHTIVTNATAEPPHLS